MPISHVLSSNGICKKDGNRTITKGANRRAILLPMQIDPVLEWQRLTAEYRQKSEGELLELAGDFNDLTEAAQQVLRSEMRSRGLGDPQSPRAPEPVSWPSQPPGSIKAQPPGVLGDQEGGGLLGLGAEMPQLVPDDPEDGNEDDGPHEYTWKTPLCNCDSSEEAVQLQAALRRAGIESWFNFQGRTTSFVPSTEHQLGIGGVEVLVAADQLDQARLIASHPIPQEIIDESKEEIPEFVEPKCPQCGSDDVVLEGVDPANTWRCEQCDKQWTESLPETVDATLNAAKDSL